MKKRIFALIMSVCMLISMIPVSAIASDHVHDASCGYVEAKACDHSHNTECGYAEAVEGAACGHNCSDGTCAFKAAIEGTPCNHSCGFDVCGYYPAIPGTPCDKGCSEIVDGEILHEDCDYSEGEPGSPCTHAHDSACGYTVAVAGTACDHSHNDACGYVAAVEGSACTHSCADGTCSYTAGSPCNYVEPTHTHSLGGWHQDGDAGHYKNCIDCPENYREETVPHSFAAACDVSCDLCGYNRGVQSSPHSFSGATCITKGSCPCGEEGDVNSANHAGGTETRGYEAAGEFTDGYTGDTYCLGCGDKISSGSTIPATHAHSWEWTYDSGMHWQKCDCGESSTAAQAHQFDDDADATCDTCGYTRTVHTHDYTAVVTAPTCSAQGYTTYTCSCGDSYMGDYVDGVDHDWGDWEFNRDGTHTRVCNTDSSHTESGSCEGIYWVYDERQHVKCWKCLVCQGGEVHDGTYDYEHIYDNATDLTCDTCGYVRTVEGRLSITGSMPAATVGEAYSASFGYTGTVSGVVFWNATGLPDGLSINAGSGVVSGTPTTVGTFSVIISMGATGGGSASKDFTLTVNAPAHTHSFSAATCTTPATCSDPTCGETTGDVDKSNHVGGTEIRGQVNAGEFTEGYTGDTYCLGCGDKLSSGSIIPATHTHSYNSYAYDRNGHWKVCTCGATQAAEDHDWYIYKKDASKHYWRCDCGNNGWGNDHFDNNNTGKCDDCGYEMPHTHIDGPSMEDVTFIPAEGTELPEDAVLVVEPHTPSADDLDFVALEEAPALNVVEDLSDVPVVPQEFDDGTLYGPGGAEYTFYEKLIINGEEYYVNGAHADGRLLLFDKNGDAYWYDGNSLGQSDIGEKVIVPDNESIRINGVVYQIIAKWSEKYALWLDGKPVGAYDRMLEIFVYFNEEYAPDKVKEKQQKSNYLGTVTTGENPIDGLVSGKTYNVSVVGSNDIHLEGAENIGGTVTQTFDIPNELVGRTDVTFVAVHNRLEHTMQNLSNEAENIESAESDIRDTNMADEMESQAREDNLRQRLEYGLTNVSEDGKTLTATYTVSSFSPFTVYAFTEAELPEVKEFVTQPDGTLARVVNGQPVTTHTVVSGENLTTIARQYGCTVDEIVALNSDLIENPRLIFAGWVLTVPEK